jgi:hypothetical protein
MKRKAVVAQLIRWKPERLPAARYRVHARPGAKPTRLVSPPLSLASSVQGCDVRDWPRVQTKFVIPGLVRERSDAASVRNPFRNR